MRPRVLCLGMSSHDALYRVDAIPSTPVKVLAHGYADVGGGMAANASVAASRLNAEAHYWGRLGDDALGDRIVADLDRAGVITGGVRRVPGAQSPASVVLLDPSGERLLCTYTDPMLGTDTGWIPLDTVAGFDAVLTDVRWTEGAVAVLNAARVAGRHAVLDADVGPRAAVAPLVDCATHIAFSAGGLARYVGDADPGRALARVEATYAVVVGVTLGSDGFLWREGGREHHAQGIAVDAVDTHAAGDVWHGALTVALAERMSMATAARFANRAAALKCTRGGARDGAPTRAELDAWNL